MEDTIDIQAPAAAQAATHDISEFIDSRRVDGRRVMSPRQVAGRVLTVRGWSVQRGRTEEWNPSGEYVRLDAELVGGERVYVHTASSVVRGQLEDAAAAMASRGVAGQPFTARIVRTGKCVRLASALPSADGEDRA